MAFDEFLTDAKPGIDTVGRDESCANAMIMPYEPTPYCVLERLCENCTDPFPEEDDRNRIMIFEIGSDI